MRTVLMIGAALAAGSCEVGNGPDDLSRVLIRETYPVPTVYAFWWDDIRGCSGRSGSFARLRFYTVVTPVIIRGTEFPCGDNLMCNGLWEAPHDITIAPAYVEHERLVKHEMLHDLLGTPGHPPVFAECGVEWNGNDTPLWGTPERP